MGSRQMMVGFLLAAGIAVVLLLVTPVVHFPGIVVHGPMTALRAQRAARLFAALIRAAALLFAGLLLRYQTMRTSLQGAMACLKVSSSPHLSCTLRC